ncbi:MAG: hypothetical protein ACYS8W_21610 [Planctomycetota bacterium]
MSFQKTPFKIEIESTTFTALGKKPKIILEDPEEPENEPEETPVKDK